MDKKKVNPLLLIIILLLLIAIGIGIYLAVGMNKKSAAPAVPSATEKPALTIDESAGEYKAPEAEAKPEVPGVTIPGWGSFTIPPHVTERNNMVDFYNPEENDGYYYLTFELLVPVHNDEDATEVKEGEEPVIEYESVYASQLVPPGKHIQSITLTHGIEPGEYDAIIHVQPYTMDDSLTPTNNADMKTKLIVR